MLKQNMAATNAEESQLSLLLSLQIKHSETASQLTGKSITALLSPN